MKTTPDEILALLKLNGWQVYTLTLNAVLGTLEAILYDDCLVIKEGNYTVKLTLTYAKEMLS